MAKSRGWMGPVVRNTPKRQQVRCPRKGKLPVTALSDDYYYVNCGLECQSVLMGLECHYGALYRPGVPQIRTPYHQRGGVFYMRLKQCITGSCQLQSSEGL